MERALTAPAIGYGCLAELTGVAMAPEDFQQIYWIVRIALEAYRFASKFKPKRPKKKPQTKITPRSRTTS